MRSRLARKPSHCARISSRSCASAGRTLTNIAFDLTGPIVDRPPERDRGLAVVREIRQHARGGHVRDVDRQMHPVVFHADGEAARAVRLEALVAGADVDAHPFLEEGG